MAKKKVKKKNAADAEPTFEESLGELEAIVESLEGGDLALAESLDQYEQAVAHLKRCHAALERAEGRIEQLSGVDKQGNPITTPYEAPGSEPRKARAPSRSTDRSAGVDDPRGLF